VRDFTPPKAQSYLALIAISQKALDVSQLDVVIAIVSTGTELDLFDLDDRLLGFGFGSFFLLLVLEFAVVHQATNWGNRSRRDFNQVNIKFTCHAKRFHEANNPKRLILNTRESNILSHNFTVQAMFAFFAVTAITKFSSDGLILQKFFYDNRS
jgi:hypothetical protein